MNKRSAIYFASTLFMLISLCVGTRAGYGFNALGATINEDLTLCQPITASPAAKAQLKEGDKILSIDGKPVQNLDDLWTIWSQTRSRQKLKLTLERKGKPFTKDITISDHTDQHQFIIRSLLSQGEPVHIVVIATHYINTFQLDPGVKNSWEQDSVKSLADSNEQELLKFSGWKNFALIDRSVLSDIIKEIQFSDSDYISPDTRVSIGKLTGANYILQVSAARYPYGPQQLAQDKWTCKFIKIETGEILSSASSQVVIDNTATVIKNYYQLQL